MRHTKFTNYNPKKLKKYDYIIYTHSFTDAQLWYGNDEFENTYDWFTFTLERLNKKNKKVKIKSHPNFHQKHLGELSYWDKHLYEKILKKYKTNKNFYFIFI